MKIAAIFMLVLAVTVLDLSTAESQPRVCNLPKKVGPCESTEQRFFFNDKTGLCESFDYGCDGNGNNFINLSDCRNRCEPGLPKVCSRPKVIGPCKRATKRFFFNAKSGNCEKFNYGGCQGNGNNFASRKACKNRCKQGIAKVCSLPSVTGNCRGAMKKFYYDAKAKECKSFTYGGCGGNGNRFDSKKECKAKCMD